MTIKEMYDMSGSDYQDIISRISSETILKKFLCKFLSDTSYNQLCTAVENRDYKEAFSAAHQLKGVSVNLGFVRLHSSSGKMAEELRAEMYENVEKNMVQIAQDYKDICELILQL